jgi:hypothetical protein
MVSLLATAAAVALIAGSASAQTYPTGPVTETNYMNPANAVDAGTVAEDITATFSISGSISASCVLGNGDADLDDVDFGTLGIYGDASNGVDNAFEMVGTNSNGNSSTNAAGCNTANTLTLTKTNGVQGLLNADALASGYDGNVFQANIPYSLGANYVAGSPGQIGVSGSLGKFTVSTTEASDSRENNAWRSGLGIRVDVPAAAKALVAGTYTDTVTVLIAVL